VMPIWPLIAGQWIIKLAIAVLDTPLVYLVIHLVRRRDCASGPASGLVAGPPA
jgi:uncharacterized PurR-regulated membrane protein YhhQ (DUF165 family)